MPVWPELDLDDLRRRARRRSQGEWMQCLATLDEEGLEEGVGYRNSKGEFWTSTVGRHPHACACSTPPTTAGRSPSAVREAGGTPAYTDFIHAVRRG